ncbi:MAG: peptidylprolyl isomerase, partial [Nannocystaceae bacterium]
GPGAFRGGDMGIFPRKQMVREYAEAAFAMRVGEVSQPVRSSKGYYVIKLFGRYDAGPLPLDAVRPDLKRQIESNKYREARAKLQKELQERYGVESPALDAARAFRDASRGRARPGPAKTAAADPQTTAPPLDARTSSKPAAGSPADK